VREAAPEHVVAGAFNPQPEAPAQQRVNQKWLWTRVVGNTGQPIGSRRLHNILEDLLPINSWEAAFNKDTDLRGTVIYEPPAKRLVVTQAMLDEAIQDEPELQDMFAEHNITMAGILNDPAVIRRNTNFDPPPKLSEVKLARKHRPKGSVARDMKSILDAGGEMSGRKQRSLVMLTPDEIKKILHMATEEEQEHNVIAKIMRVKVTLVRNLLQKHKKDPGFIRQREYKAAVKA
jgi:hypothetical protein